MVDLAGPLSVASFAGEGSDVPDWARTATPHYLNYRKVSIYGGSNEVQRTIIAGSILGLCRELRLRQRAERPPGGGAGSAGPRVLRQRAAPRGGQGRAGLRREDLVAAGRHGPA